jgi:uncharacterized membrane protein YtjA (UPF0391 family)
VTIFLSWSELSTPVGILRKIPRTEASKMLAWAVTSALVCVISGALGFSHFLAATADGQSLALLMMSLAGVVSFGAFDAYESSPRQANLDSAGEG